MRMKKFFLFPPRAVCYLFVLVVMLPIEYPLWKAYKAEGFQVENYWKFLWLHTFGPHPIYHKSSKPKNRI